MDKDKIARATLKESLMKLNKRQLKLFYGMLVHAWASRKAFISTQNFYNLWCELNYLCAMVDEGFPDPYDDHKLLRSFCHTYPYYFIDILSPDLIINLFCDCFDDRLDVLIEVVDKLRTEGLWAAYACCNEALVMTEDVEKLVLETDAYIGYFT